MAYIRYQSKANGHEYAFLLGTSRNGFKVDQQYHGNLGRVIDKKAGIFKSRERGLFRYTVEEGYCDLPEGYQIPQSTPETEQLILDFGDSFFLHEYFKMQEFRDAIYKTFPTQSDSVLSLVFYKILTDKKAYCYADTWWQGNYSSQLFPGAKLASQRVSEHLEYIGSEEVQRAFFQEYFRLLYGKSGATGVLIDSTGIPNASKMEVTQITNRNGEISLEAKLIYVIDRRTGMPIYFRYCSGNIVDVSTLCTTLAELRQYNINIDYAIIDAGYCCEDNIVELYQHKAKFITRIAPNRTLFKQVTTEHMGSLTSAENAVRYGNRLLYMKKAQIDLYGNAGFAYIGVDVDSKNQQVKKVMFESLDDKLSPSEIDEKVQKLGVFMIISSENIDTNEVLPLYYTRQQIEQVFDVGKNNADILPIRIHNESTLRGHLMITFLATIILQMLQRDIIAKSKKKDKINPEGAFTVLRNQKCKVYSQEIVPQEAVKKMNDVYRLFGIKCPSSMKRNL